ncbi:MAG: YceI family protein [Candidatus Omnitrophota bacterium]
MKNIFIVFGIITLSGIMFLKPVMADQTTYAIDTSQSLIKFSFRSTLHEVEGKAHRFKGTFQTDSESDHFLESGDVHVETSSLDTQNEKRDEQMFLMFDSKHFPDIRYSFSTVMPQASKDSRPRSYVLKGQLTIKDQSQNIEIPVVIAETEEGIVLSGDVDLSLKALNLKPPSVLMLIRVFDTVHIHFQSLLKEISS